MEKIFVAVRVRPPKADETNTTGTHWKFEDNRISLHRRLGTPISGLSYAFDHVFDERCTNERIYETLTKGIVHAAVQGFNGTAFAYGQTSSGKTFTMNGSESDPGIIHRAVRDIFEMIQATTDREYLIRVSYMEIYNEDIHDLFTVENQKLQIHESLERGIYVAGLKEEIVNNSEQVLQLLQSGEVNRHFGETNMNVRSSRSHTIFRMVIESRGKDTHHSIEYSSADAIRVSVLNLVDLAGSERIAKTGAGGVRLREGKYINKSLMVLGNVINKLSDGVKQRGHIPYRDSKLTRILQPALGGNAKTSIVCTIAPEEIHVEETKGTLQFASRAKRITNCAQVNEILTDAALLKRQKLEIEELRNKLQGSRSEVLEQEILKLRNDMLKYELEREKLAMELEEERRSQKERERHIREQQMELNNLNTLFSNSDGDGISTQSNDSAKQNLKEEFSDGHHISQEEAFKTPCFKALPNTFVARRSNYSKLPECSPLPESISNVADEDTWLKMNKGFKANLDLLVTPARNVQSFPSSDSTLAFSNDNHKEEIHLLRKQLEIAAEEKNEQKKIQVEQEQLNKQLMQEISQLRQEAMLVRKIPERLFESLTNCKDMYEDTMSVMQDVVADKKPTAAKIISCTTDIGISLFSTLESHFKMAMDENSSLTDNYSLMQEQCEVLLRERLNRTISSLVISEEPKVDDELVSNLSTSTKKGCALGGDEAAWWKEKLSSEFEVIKDKYQSLEKQFQENNHLLEVSKERYQNLEKDFRSLKAERDSLQQTVSKSTQKLTLLANEKENAMKDLSSEVNRQKDLAEGMKHFSVAFASRQRSLLSFHSEFKSKVESLRTQNHVPVLKPVG